MKTDRDCVRQILAALQPGRRSFEWKMERRLSTTDRQKQKDKSGPAKASGGGHQFDVRVKIFDFSRVAGITETWKLALSCGRKGAARHLAARPVDGAKFGWLIIAARLPRDPHNQSDAET